MALLAKRPGLETVKVARHYEGLSKKAGAIPSAIWLGAVSNRLEIPTMRGGDRRPRQETYSLIVHFLAVKAGAGTSTTGDSTAAQVEARVLALLAELENLLAENITLGLSDTGFHTATLSGWEMGDVTQEERGWSAPLDAELLCKARLS